MENCRDNMLVLKQGLEKTGKFNIVSKDNGVPLVAFSLKDSSFHNEFEVSDMLRRFGWIVPAYTMPPDAQHVTVLRVVIREDFSRTLAERLVIDVGKVLHELETLPSRISANIVLANEEKDAVADKDKKDVQNETREIITAWRKLVIQRKKMNGVC
jgi:glutamate decarboxylase